VRRQPDLRSRRQLGRLRRAVPGSVGELQQHRRRLRRHHRRGLDRPGLRPAVRRLFRLGPDLRRRGRLAGLRRRHLRQRLRGRRSQLRRAGQRLRRQHRRSGGSWPACDASSYGNDYEATETSCDSLDNDCDGTTDDDCPCTPNDTQTCSSNEGECVEGTQTCDAGGTWGACDGTLPREETCDGLDNDCDTQTDEDLTGLPCPLQDGVCAGVAAACGGTEGWVCSYGATYEESETLCDDLDNDCDGDTDEDCGEDVVEGSCGCGTGNAGLALLPLFLLVFIIRRR
jgi:hypothetical protein